MAAFTTVALAVAAVGTAAMQAKAQSDQGDYQKRMSNINARLADLQATETIKQGFKDEQLHRGQVRQVAGAQRASLAAQGIDVGSGTAADLQQETFSLGAEDALNIRMNAYKQAWGFNVEAENHRITGDMGERAGRNAATGSLLSGATQAGTTIYSGYKAGVFSKG